MSFPTPKPGVGFSDSAMLYKVICFASPSVFDAAPACWFRVGLEQRLARKRADATMRPLGPLDLIIIIIISLFKSILTGQKAAPKW